MGNRMDVIGREIRRLREEQGITQNDLGEAIGRSESSIAKYEQGKVEIPVNVLNRIEEVLEVEKDYLLRMSQKKLYIKTEHGLEEIHNFLPGHPFHLSTPEELILGHFEKLSDAGQEKAFDFLKLLTEVPRYQRESPPTVTDVDSSTVDEDE